MLDRAIAGITDGFSFAYIQEAFVASLLAIAALDEDDEEEEETGGSHHLTVKEEEENHEEQNADKDLEEYILWREMKKQVKILRKELGQDVDDEGDGFIEEVWDDEEDSLGKDPQSGECSCGDGPDGVVTNVYEESLGCF